MTAERINQLAAALRGRFQAIVEPDEVRPGRYRIDMMSDQFAAITPGKRHDLVWAVIDEVLTPEETDDRTLILPFAPGETEQFLPV